MSFISFKFMPIDKLLGMVPVLRKFSKLLQFDFQHNNINDFAKVFQIEGMLKGEEKGRYNHKSQIEDIGLQDRLVKLEGGYDDIVDRYSKV